VADYVTGIEARDRATAAGWVVRDRGERAYVAYAPRAHIFG